MLLDVLFVIVFALLFVPTNAIRLNLVVVCYCVALRFSVCVWLCVMECQYINNSIQLMYNYQNHVKFNDR